MSVPKATQDFFRKFSRKHLLFSQTCAKIRMSPLRRGQEKRKMTNQPGRLTIHELTLHNFKGIREFGIAPEGQDITIYGDNATGKTTVADALYWILFDKDSLNRKDFEIKTIDPFGGPMHNLNHEGELTLNLPKPLNGVSGLTLKKCYSENWTKKRGSIDSTFSGHSTDHYVNGVPVQKKEYDDIIDSLVPSTAKGTLGRGSAEKLFRLLTDPNAFNVHMPWQERRTLLLDVCGDVTDKEVMASDPALADLPTILGNRSLDDHRKVITARRRELNNEIEKIPVRIDEATRSLPSVILSPVEGAASIPEIQSAIDNLNKEKARLESGGEVAEQTKKLRETEAQIQDRATTIKKEASKDHDQWQVELRNKSTELNSASIAEDRALSDHKEAMRKIERLNDEASLLRDQYRIENDKALAFTQSETCPACQQSLPAERLAEARTKAEEEFNLAKAKRLEKITVEGKQKAAEAEELKLKTASMWELYGAKQATVKKLEEELAEIQLTAHLYQVGDIDLAKDAQYTTLLEQKNSLETKIEALKSDFSTAVAAIQARINEESAKLQEANRQNAQIEEAERTKKRIAELEIEQKSLANEHERLSREFFLTEQFIRAKVALLTGRINSRFKIANFRLFEEQVNGGISEVCEATVEGVPYGSLNHGTRLNVGLDVINTLAEHFGFAPPVIIDNAESVTQIMPTIGQQVRLVVSAKDKSLRTVVSSPVEGGGSTKAERVIA